MWKKHTDVSSVLVFVKIVVASQHKKRQRKKSLSTFVDNWKRKLVHALHYANELLLRVRLAFQKLLQTHQTSRNYQKQVLVMIKHCLGNSQISSIPAWSKELFYITFLYRTLAKVYALARADIYYSFTARNQRNFWPWKLTLSLTRSIKVHRRSLVPYSLPSVWKIRKRIYQFLIFDPSTWQHPREKPRHVRGYMTSGWRNLF